MGQLMSDPLSYATAAPGVHASRYGRRLRQRGLNNASETLTVLRNTVFLRSYPQNRASSMRFQLRCIHNPPLSSCYSSADRLPKHISCGPVQRLSTTEF
jgi:hypothetical protein